MDVYVCRHGEERECVCVCAFVDTCEWYFSFLLTFSFSFTCGLTKSLETSPRKKTHNHIQRSTHLHREKKKNYIGAREMMTKKNKRQ